MPICQGVTKKGVKCTKPVNNVNHPYCHFHKIQGVPTPASVQPLPVREGVCSGVTIRGKLCTKTCLIGDTGRCRYHVDQVTVPNPLTSTGLQVTVTADGRAICTGKDQFGLPCKYLAIYTNGRCRMPHVDMDIDK